MTARPVDPALLALITTLGSATPPAVAPSIGQQVAGRIAALLQLAGGTLAGLFGSSDGGVRGGGPEAGRPAEPAGATIVPPRAPQQPPPPALTIDPALGTIVLTDPDGQIPLGGTSDPAQSRTPLVPSSWVPVATGTLRRIGDDARAGILRMVGALDDWLDSVGMSRLQLLALTLLGPLAVTMLIAFVSALLGQ
jgi:hypothetical protein